MDFGFHTVGMRAPSSHYGFCTRGRVVTSRSGSRCYARYFSYFGELLHTEEGDTQQQARDKVSVWRDGYNAKLAEMRQAAHKAATVKPWSRKLINNN